MTTSVCMTIRVEGADPSLEGVLVGYHAALRDWRCFFRQRWCGKEASNMTCQFVIKVLFWFRYLLHCTRHHQFIAHTQLESRMESIRQCIVSIPRSSQMQLELTVTQKICSYSPQTSQNLHNVFTDLLKCNDRSCVPTLNRFISLELGFT